MRTGKGLIVILLALIIIMAGCSSKASKNRQKQDDPAVNDVTVNTEGDPTPSETTYAGTEAWENIKDYSNPVYVDESSGIELSGGGFASSDEDPEDALGYSASDYYGVTGWVTEGSDDTILFLTFYKDGTWECADGSFSILRKGEYTVSGGSAIMTDTNGGKTQAYINELGTLIWNVGEDEIIFTFE